MNLNTADPPGPECPQDARDWAWQGRCTILRKQGRHACSIPCRKLAAFPKGAQVISLLQEEIRPTPKHPLFGASALAQEPGHLPQW